MKSHLVHSEEHRAAPDPGRHGVSSGAAPGAQSDVAEGLLRARVGARDGGGNLRPKVETPNRGWVRRSISRLPPTVRSFR